MPPVPASIQPVNAGGSEAWWGLRRTAVGGGWGSTQELPPGESICRHQHWYLVTRLGFFHSFIHSTNTYRIPPPIDSHTYTPSWVCQAYKAWLLFTHFSGLCHQQETLRDEVMSPFGWRTGLHTADCQSHEFPQALCPSPRAQAPCAMLSPSGPGPVSLLRTRSKRNLAHTCCLMSWEE